jgi:hypothetical protein
MSTDSLIANFAAASGPGAFPNIRRTDVVDGLRARLADASTQNQGAASLCGPAAFLFCLLVDQPEVYVQYVVDLYTSGKAKIGSLAIHPSDKCRRYSPNPRQIAPVDWIALASLRDSENSVFDYDSVKDTASGITMPHSMAAWFRAAGYRSVNNVTNVFFTKGRSDIDTAHHLTVQGRWVCLFVNAAVIEKKPDLGRTLSPNHWVVLLDPGGPVKDGKFNITIYTWGEERRVPATGDMEVKGFCHGLYGYVSAVYPRTS